MEVAGTLVDALLQRVRDEQALGITPPVVDLNKQSVHSCRMRLHSQATYLRPDAHERGRGAGATLFTLNTLFVSWFYNTSVMSLK